MFVLKGILRAESQEKILLYLLVRESGYGKAIAEFFGLSTNSVQKQLARLEEDSVVVSRAVGRMREYQLNPGMPLRWSFHLHRSPSVTNESSKPPWFRALRATSLF